MKMIKIIIGDLNGNKNNKIINSLNERRNIKWDNKNIYILSDNKIFKYNTNDKYIKEWKSHGSTYFNLIVDKNIIYISYDKFIIIYSNEEEFIKIIKIMVIYLVLM